MRPRQPATLQMGFLAVVLVAALLWLWNMRVLQQRMRGMHPAPEEPVVYHFRDMSGFLSGAYWLNPHGVLSLFGGVPSDTPFPLLARIRSSNHEAACYEVRSSNESHRGANMRQFHLLCNTTWREWAPSSVWLYLDSRGGSGGGGGGGGGRSDSPPAALSRIPVKHIQQPTLTKKIRLGICLAPLYRSTDDGDNGWATLLVEWIEANRLLGVQWFTIYVDEIAPSLASVLNYYAAQDLLQVVNWRKHSHMGGFYRFQTLSMLDCLYRNKERLSHLMFIDSDELILPQQFVSLSHMLSVNYKKYRTFIVTNHFSLPMCTDPFASLFVERMPWREIVSAPRLKRAKYIVSTTAVHGLGVHHNNVFPRALLPTSWAILMHWKGLHPSCNWIGSAGRSPITDLRNFTLEPQLAEMWPPLRSKVAKVTCILFHSRCL